MRDVNPETTPLVVYVVTLDGSARAKIISYKYYFNYINLNLINLSFPF